MPQFCFGYISQLSECQLARHLVCVCLCVCVCVWPIRKLHQVIPVIIIYEWMNHFAEPGLLDLLMHFFSLLLWCVPFFWLVFSTWICLWLWLCIRNGFLIKWTHFELNKCNFCLDCVLTFPFQYDQSITVIVSLHWDHNEFIPTLYLPWIQKQKFFLFSTTSPLPSPLAPRHATRFVEKAPFYLPKHFTIYEWKTTCSQNIGRLFISIIIKICSKPNVIKIEEPNNESANLMVLRVVFERNIFRFFTKFVFGIAFCLCVCLWLPFANVNFIGKWIFVMRLVSLWIAFHRHKGHSSNPKEKETQGAIEWERTRERETKRVESTRDFILPLAFITAMGHG